MPPPHTHRESRLSLLLCPPHTQGEFNSGEPVAAIFAWVADALSDPLHTYELICPDRRPLAVGVGSVREADLLPSTTLFFRQGRGLMWCCDGVRVQVMGGGRIAACGGVGEGGRRRRMVRVCSPTPPRTSGKAGSTSGCEGVRGQVEWGGSRVSVVQACSPAPPYS